MDKWIRKGQKILVVVPHEDDELLMTAGVIRRAVMEGTEVKVVMATNGDYDQPSRESGLSRMQETLDGLAYLGLPREQVIFLGYADTGMPREESFLASLYEAEDENQVYISHCGVETYGLVGHPSYHQKRYGEECAYTRRNFYQDLKTILDEEKADVLITTSEYDTHGDHSGLYEFVRDVLIECRQEKKKIPMLLTGVVHSMAGDENWPEPNQNREVLAKFTCPKGLSESSDLSWEKRIQVPVPEEMRNPDMAKNQKYQAISHHKTALKLDAVDFLYAFVKADEIFWERRI